MRHAVVMVLWAATLGVAGLVLWRTTNASPPDAEAASATAAAGNDALPAGATSPPSALFAYSPFQPLPRDVPLDAAKVALGARLFADKALSVDGTVSCASCHDLSRGGADSRRLSVGVHGAVGTRNTPTVFNSGFNFRQFWDGRAATLEEQVDGPLLNPAEMGAHWPEVLQHLSADETCAAAFGALYADGVTIDNTRDVIATFECSLFTPNSRFDRYLRGEKALLTSDEVDGCQLFMESGCASCHQGVNVGGNMFQTFGRMGDYFADRGDDKAADPGRFAITGDPRDRSKFKVPSLRNVDLTAPYFHDGSVATLEEAVRVMARYQTGQDLHPDEVAKIVAFLKTLTGDTPRHP